ncbi:hypothetical protein EON65_11820, partial [archaeon]
MNSSGEVQRSHKFTKELQRTLSVGKVAKRKVQDKPPKSSSPVLQPVDHTIDISEESTPSPKKAKKIVNDKVNKQAKKVELVGEVRIGVIVMGDISPRIFSTWTTNLPKRIQTLQFLLYSKINPGAKFDIVVADVRLSRDQITKSLGDSDLTAPIVSSQYIIDAIKTSSLPLLEDYLHPVQVNGSFSVAESKIASLSSASPITCVRSPVPASPPLRRIFPR